MQIDFHFTVTYVLARLANYTQSEAQTIANSAQYVDDATHSGMLLFDNHAGYEFFSSAHKMLDYRNFEELSNHYCWIPFHFLPGNRTDDPLFEGVDPFIQKLICQPNSETAQLLIKRTIQKKMKSYHLHQLGILMHTYADTWAHQKFCGISHEVNGVEEILDGHNQIATEHKSHIRKFFKKTIWDRIISFLMTEYSPLGHGPVLSLPDRPYLTWQYINHNGKLVTRNNTEIFLDACDHLYSTLINYKEDDLNLTMHPLPSIDREMIKKLFLKFTSDNPQERYQGWLSEIARGSFSFGAENVSYSEKAWEKELWFKLPEENEEEKRHIPYKEEFFNTNWKLFHDAMVDHRKTILHEILPSLKITVV